MMCGYLIPPEHHSTLMPLLLLKLSQEPLLLLKLSQDSRLQYLLEPCP